MKITNFSFTIRQAVVKDGYGDNYYVNIDENGVTTISHPYKSIEHREQAAILSIIRDAIVKYGIMVNECDKVNRALKLEEYAPIESAEEEKGIAAAKLSARQELELADVSAAPQSCALGDEELSTGADGDIDKPKPTIVITKVTEEDNW